MRSLPAELLAAQRSTSAAPFLQVHIGDCIGGVRRLRFHRLYSGGEPPGPHAAACPGDGSLLRARVAGGQLYYQRLSSPGPGSDFAAWTALASASQEGIALAARGADVLLCYVDGSGNLVARRSQDYGASFAPAAVVVPASSGARRLAVAIKGPEDALLLYATDSTVLYVRQSGGVWGSPAAWPHSLASASGLAAHYARDFDVVVTGIDGDGRAGVWATVYGDGYRQGPGTWSALREVQRADAGSGVSFAAPSLALADVYRLTFVEAYSGNQSYTRLQHTYTALDSDFADNLWREPFPEAIDLAEGVAVAVGSDAVWLSHPAGVWRALSGTADTDVSADVLALEATERPFGGSLRLLLRNEDGRYSGEGSLIAPGSEVSLGLGYLTSAGPLASPGPSYWIEAVERQGVGGRGLLLVEGETAWGLLARWRARRQFVWTAGQRTVFAILQALFARAGLRFTARSFSWLAANLYPAFSVQPGESGLLAVRRLLALLPDVALLGGPYVYLKEPREDESPIYAYGPQHPIREGRYRSAAPEANRVQVFGQGIFWEEFRWEGIGQTYDRLLQLHDANLTSGTQASRRALAELRRHTIASEGGEVTAPVNCGLELYDVVTVDDPALGPLGARRVRGLTLRYDATKGVYEQHLALGRP